MRMSLIEALAGMLCLSKTIQMDSEEYSLGQEDRIVVIKDVAGEEREEDEK